MGSIILHIFKYNTEINYDSFNNANNINNWIENKTIGISYMYPNETINPKHHIHKSTNNNQ